MLTPGPQTAASAVPQPCCPCHAGAEHRLFLLRLFILAGGQGASSLPCRWYIALGQQARRLCRLSLERKEGFGCRYMYFFNFKGQRQFLNNFFHLHPKPLHFF